ncbi:MAG: hypothetical protein QOE75_2397 [Solirubrobacterales bacterium]|nr:hypothetical protein [Solirubrobacterales bacterium]
MDRDELRSTALLTWPQPPPRPEALAGLPRPFQRRAASLPQRLLEAIAWRRGQLDWASGVAEPLTTLREQLLGTRAAGPPRVLLRVDEFPHARGFDAGDGFTTDAYRRFHAVLAEAGVPYLLAITPRVSREYADPAVEESRPLEDSEIECLQALDREGVVFGLHGADHRTRHASPRRHSELTGLSPAQTAERIDAARASFAQIGLATPVFVPPFNRFGRRQYDLLADRFEVVCGGPESIRLLGFSPTPAWRGEAVYLPSYPPLYERAGRVLAELERLRRREAGIWAPATLHWGWELEDSFAALTELAAALAGCTTPWVEFLDAVGATRELA